MTDPISIVGLVIAVGGAAQTVLSYALEAKDASQDINILLTELLAVKGFLEQLQSDQQQKAAKLQSPEFAELLQSGVQVIQNLELDLARPPSKIRGVLRQLKWPLKKDDVRKHVERLERLKSFCLLMMVRENASNDEDIKAEVRDLRHFLEEDHNERRSDKLDEARQKLLLELAPVDTETVHISAYGRHHPGTNAWFLRDSLRALTNAEPVKSAILWLKGKSGSGKTVLMSQAIEYLKSLAKEDERMAVAYFYCTFDNQSSHEPRHILGSLLAQLSTKVPALLDEAQNELNRSQNSSPEELVAAFSRSLARCTEKLSTVYIVVDAVNESSRALDITTILLRLAHSSSHFRFLFSSTEDSKLPSVSHYCHVVQIGMDSSDVDSDIEVYVDDQLAKKPSLRRYTQSLKADIRKAIFELSDGNFRYARWQIDHLASLPTGRDVRKALRTLPQNLNESYAQFLNDTPMESPERRYLRKALLWLCFAGRPLLLHELAEAVAIEEGDTGLDSDDKLDDPNMIVRLAHGLIDYDHLTGTVSLSHFSVRSCLTSEWIQTSSIADFAMSKMSAHKSLFRWCLTYLLFDDFTIGYRFHSQTKTLHLRNQYPLLSYVAYYWHYHLQDPDDNDGSLLCRFLATREEEKAGNYGRWLFEIFRTHIPLKVVQGTHPLYYASSLGLDSLVKAIIKFDPTANLNAPGGMKGSWPVHAAGFRRHKEASRILIEAGADPLAEDPGMSPNSGVNAVFWAKTNRWYDVLALIEQKYPGSTGTSLSDFERKIMATREATELSFWEVARPGHKGNSECVDHVPARCLTKEKLQRFLEVKYGERDYHVEDRDGRLWFGAPRAFSALDLSSLEIAAPPVRVGQKIDGKLADQGWGAESAYLGRTHG